MGLLCPIFWTSSAWVDQGTSMASFLILKQIHGMNKGWEMLGVLVHRTLNSVEKNQPMWPTWSLNHIYLNRDWEDCPVLLPPCEILHKLYYPFCLIKWPSKKKCSPGYCSALTRVGLTGIYNIPFFSMYTYISAFSWAPLSRQIFFTIGNVLHCIIVSFPS